MNRTLLVIAAFTVVGLFWGCEQAKEEGVYLPQQDVRENSRIKWYSTFDNHALPGFSDTLDHYVRTRAENGEMDSASIVLWAAHQALRYRSIYDTAMVMRSKRFVWKYGDQIPRNIWGGIHLNIGGSLMHNNELDSGLFYLRKGMVEPYDYRSAEFNESLNREVAKYYYYHTSHADSAIAILLKSIEAYEKLDHLKGLSNCYGMLAGLYKDLGKPNKQLEFRRKAIELSTKANLRSDVLIDYMNYYFDLYALNKKEEAAVAADTLFALNEELGSFSPFTDFILECVFATQKLETQDVAAAGVHLQNADSIAKKLTEGQRQFDLYIITKFDWQLASGQLPEVSPEMDSLFMQMLRDKQYRAASNLGGFLATAEQNRGNYQAALGYLKQAHLADDSLKNIGVMQRIAELNEQNEVEKKERTIAVQQLRIARSRTTSLALGLGLVIVLAGSSLFFVHRKRKTQQREAEQHQEFTRQLLHNTERERGRIANDLHDGVGHELLSLKAGIASGRQDLGFTVESILNDVRSISRNLHPVLFEKVGLKLSTQQLAERMSQQHNFMISTELDDYKGGLSSDAELQLYRIIQEALSNIIKYAQAHAAKVTLGSANGMVTAEVRDNGKGFDVSESLKGGKSFGLHSIMERAAAIGGQAQIESSSSGTVITISIPKA